MHYHYYQPHPALKHYVKCFWTSERDFSSLNGVMDILPDSYFDLVFNLGTTCYYDDGKVSGELPVAYLTRLVDRPLRLYTKGVLRSVGVRFFAWGFHHLLDMPIDSKAVIFPLDHKWSNLKHQIKGLMASNDTQAAIHLLQAHILKMLKSRESIPDYVLSPHQLLFESKGILSIHELANSAYLSRRQIERGFQTLIGLSPKTMARTIRFQNIRDAISQEPNADLTSLAHHYGYSDQAHLSREFKHFSQRTPTQFINEIRTEPDSLRFGVAFPDK